MIFWIVGSIVAAGVGTIRYFGLKSMRHRHYTSKCTPPKIDKEDIVFTGQSLNIGESEIHLILTKRFNYYNLLSKELKPRFIQRLRSFMSKKIFIIKDDEGFKDMPVLVSAAAIQLSFGLKNYKIPFYQYIRIYPEEYFSENEFLKVLAGNVQNNVISVAWNQILKSYADSSDGSNIGLHEMSHALYIQKIVIEKDFPENFYHQYDHLVTECSEAYKIEAEGKTDLYSAYADTDLQEFWAESVELFFEKPDALVVTYPRVFEAMKILLNQDPRNHENPLLKTYLSFNEKIKMVNKLLLKKIDRIVAK